MPKRIASVAAALALALGAFAPADAQTLYKWIDAQGKTQYSDKPPPKGFAGTVTPLEPEYDRSPARIPAPPAPPAAEPPSAEEAKPAPQSINSKRRENRLQLEARLAKARANVEAAKKLMADTEAPEPDERQTIQQRVAGGGMHGLNAARSNCRIEVGKDGRKVNMCPTSVPTPEYHDRIARQEEALRKAEEELAAAEEAWRRGVD